MPTVERCQLGDSCFAGQRTNVVLCYTSYVSPSFLQRNQTNKCALLVNVSRHRLPVDCNGSRMSNSQDALTPVRHTDVLGDAFLVDAHSSQDRQGSRMDLLATI